MFSMLISLLLVATVARTVASIAMQSRPNILFVLTDDMGWGDVSYNKEYYQPGAGGKKWTVNPPRTPNIDSMAMGEHTMLFRRWYTGSAVCSPTRASVLTGRTPQRSCIDSAEGCGQSPAWSCYDKMPLPPTEFTVAEAAKEQGYATLFVGKWHLGDFWNKGESGKFALQKWPASHPGMHGFDEWAATEASAASSTPNCGCNENWKNQGKGCITGGGFWQTKAYDCTNYWSPADLNSKHMPGRPECHVSKSTARDCLANLTTKIEGDDSQHIMDVFEEFLRRKVANGSEPSPWFAQLSIHTNHEPHPSLPEWYNAYKEAEGGPAGDYLGTISQMDAAIGRLATMLKEYGVHKETMLWFSAGDNGAHTTRRFESDVGAGQGDGRPSGQLAASNGLRQCKGSLFEGGIRVGGFVQWPAVINTHTETLHAAVTNDFLPTILELLGMKHPHPTWYSDGMSLLPLLKGDISPSELRSQPIGFAQSGQVAWMNDTGVDGVWKIIVNPVKGQCEEFLPPYGQMKDTSGPFLFNLTADPTESFDLCQKETARCSAMTKAMHDFMDSIQHSRVYESECQQAGPAPTPSPSPPSLRSFRLVSAAGKAVAGECLTLQSLAKHADVALGSCDAWSTWNMAHGGLVSDADGSMCVKVDAQGTDKPCTVGNNILMGECKKGNVFHLDASGRLVADMCKGLCAKPAAKNASNSFVTVVLGSCTSLDAITFSKKDAGLDVFTV